MSGHCEVIEVRNSADAVGYSCRCFSITTAYNCTPPPRGTSGATFVWAACQRKIFYCEYTGGHARRLSEEARGLPVKAALLAWWGSLNRNPATREGAALTYENPIFVSRHW